MKVIHPEDVSLIKKPRSKRMLSIKPGDVFGRLTILKITPVRDNIIVWRADCKCACGAIREDMGLGNILSGAITSCGCFRIEQLQKKIKTHGMSLSPTYVNWCNMTQRCKGLREMERKYYSDRGISVCKRWGKFKNFLKDMGERPTARHSIDRIDNNKGYYPKNCRWATPAEQLNNTSRTVRLEFKGEIKTLSEWAILIGVKLNTLHWRRRRNASPSHILKELV